MSPVDLHPFTPPLLFHPQAERLPPVSLSDLVLPLSDGEISEVEDTLREVTVLLSKTPGAAGSMRRRIGIIMDCLLAVADELDGDAEAEATAPERFGGGFDGAGHGEDDEGAQCDDEGQHDDNGIADDDGRSEQWGHQDQHGAWVLG